MFLCKYLFLVQDTLTILCNQLPFISSINDSSLQCARLRLNNNIPSSDFNLDNPSEISLFAIIDQLPIKSSVNININFSQSSDSFSSIDQIYIAVSVVHSNFTINNDTTTIYSLNDIVILHWNNSQPNLYQSIDLIQLTDNEYVTDKSMCQWNNDLWNRLFNTNSSYGYFLKTTNTNLIFTLIDTTNIPAPSPYLLVLYCFPYKLGSTELILIICSAILFLFFLLILSILHYCKHENYLSGTLQQQPPPQQQQQSPRPTVKHTSFANPIMTSIDDET